MCKEGSKIKFCTCRKEIVHTGFADEVSVLYSIKEMDAIFALDESEEEYNSTFFKWELYRVQGKGSLTLGSMVYSQSQLRDYLTVDHILNVLNNDNCFDFEYTPQERDRFLVKEVYTYVELESNRRPNLGNRMIFRFEEGKWKVELYPLDYHFYNLEKGKVELRDVEPTSNE